MKTLGFREKVLCLFLFLVTVICIFEAGKIGIGLTSASAFEKVDPRKNTLILSVCSLRRDLLTEYGHFGPEIMPNLESFFRDSTVIFKKAFNGIPWISFISFFEQYYPELRERGFGRPGPFSENPYWRIPVQKSQKAIEFRDVNDSDWEKDYRTDFEYIKDGILKGMTRPFTLLVHIKYMHYPLIDYFNPDSQWDFYLNAEEKALVREYVAHPEIYYKKLPFLLMLTGDPVYAVHHPAVKARPNLSREEQVRLLGLVTNDQFLQEWKQSSNFATDLSILKKIYAANARFLDSHILGPMMNLYGDKELQATTSVIFSGDHGEVHMERDKLTHATSAFDEALAIPAAIHIPRSRTLPIRVEEQVHIHTIAAIAKDVAVGEANPKNIREKMEEHFEEALIMRDCSNTYHALRFKNKYKFIIDDASGRRSLYDLEKDPGELVDLAAIEPALAAEMEAQYWAVLPRFKEFSPYRCAPWDL